ncbi:MAG: TonB-dependent receptor [Arcobacteraceae bacterium]|nr:TonB-dependent receptor [Arcobacteraceae bacterium]
MKILVSLCLFYIFLFANDDESLSSLLQKYKKYSDLSHKTRNETIGHISVITGDDIKKMQANKLSDVLKSLKMFNYMDNVYGVHNLTVLSSANSVSSAVRMYLNDHELSSVHTMSPFLAWDDLPLDFISHIDVYYGEGSFILGNEPGTTIIKIYTKSPYYENGGLLRNTISSKNENETSLMYSSNGLGEWAYLAFVNQSNSKYKEKIDGVNISKDSRRKYAYLSLQRNKQSLDFGYSDISKDPFTNLTSDLTPNKTNLETTNYFLSYSDLFDNDTIKLNISFDQNNRKFYSSNDEGLLIVPVIDFTNAFTTVMTTPKEFEEDLDFSKYQASLSKTFLTENNSFTIIGSYKQKKYKLNTRSYTDMMDRYFDNVKFSEFDKEEIYSLMFEDVYRLNNSNHLIANIRFDKYNKNGGLKNHNERMYRIGHIWMANDNFGIKSFISHTYLAPSFYLSDFASSTQTNQTKDLESEDIRHYSIEGVYADENNRISLMYIHLEIDKFFVPDSNTGLYYNYDQIVTGDSLLLEYERQILSNHKLYLNYNIAKSNQATRSSKSGGTLRVTGSFDDFDYFGELIYKRGYKIENIKIKDGYDVNIGVTYNITKDLAFLLKGENIFSKGSKIPYKDYLTNEYKVLSNNQPKALCSLKWQF